MNHEICIYLDFLSEAHRERIRETAEAGGFVPHFFTLDQFDEASACLRHCEVLYAQSPALLRTAPASLKWFCSATAGVEDYCREDGLFANPDCLLTNTNCYGVTIAEHIIMVTLMLLRRMPEYIESAKTRDWGAPLPIRSIRGSRFTMLGTGNIGSTAAARLRAMGAERITGVSRSGRPLEGFDEVRPFGALDDVLAGAEFLIMSLPNTAETAGLLNRERIALLPRGACVVNVGRGNAIDQEALADALNSGRLAGAALDVTVPEPLPKEHPLWNVKNLVLTPHVSGNVSLGYTRDLNVEMFCEDLQNYMAGRPLRGLVDRRRGY